MTEYTFSAPCPPQTFKAHLSAQVAAMQAGFGKEVRLKLKWRGEMAFELRAVFFQEVRSRLYIHKEWDVSEPFCGMILPDGAGSVLRGRFPFWSLSALCITGFGAVALAVAFWVRWPLLAAVALLLTAWNLYHHWRRKDRCADSQWILEMLQQIAQTAPPEQETEF